MGKKEKALPKLNGIVSTNCSSGRLQVPDWVCDILKLPENKIARLEWNSQSENRYPIILNYLAHHAVDITEEPPVPIDNNTKNVTGKKPQLAVREQTGRLSSLHVSNSMENDILMNLSGSDSDSETDSDSEQELPRPIYHFGLGAARLLFEGQDVCAFHSEDLKRLSNRRLHLFAADEKVLRSLGDAAVKWDYERSRPDETPRKGKYHLYTLNIDEIDGVFWNDQGWKDSRSLKSVILPDGMLKSLVRDFRDFSAKGTKSWYASHGLPHRRSYLFYGPPGVGKTSTIRALSGELQLVTCFLTLGDYMVSNRDLQIALRIIPRPSMLVIEDIDALFGEDRKSENPSPLTFSGLLNALDGLISADGVLTVLTTNHIDRLDPALIRAGRVDRKFEFKLPSQEQMAALFSSFYPDEEKDIGREFAEAVFKRTEKEARSIATLQEHFIFTRKMSARESVDALDTFFSEFYPEGGYDRSTHIYM